ncbi:MAG: ComF family protein [Anaerolineae bacterium]|nr:ComF family protein [Anaerolineae bacterium]
MSPTTDHRLRVSRDWSTRLLDLLFPSRCVNCGRPGAALCADCLATIQPISSPTCPRCGNPLSSPDAVCFDCRAHPKTITQIQSVCWHDEVARRAVHALKYKKRRDVAPELARFLVAKLAVSELDIDLITGVPLYPVRELERGYNQADLLAIHTANARGLAYKRVMRRTRATRDQIELDAAARRLNVKNALFADEQQVAGKNVLLVDDVATTGATLEACASALFQARARGVYGLTVTRPRPGN